MSTATPPPPPPARGVARLVANPPVWWLPALLTAAVLLAYANSFTGAFIFDDPPSIRDNPSIRSLTTALFPPAGSWITVSGRPVLNFSFAIDHLVGGFDVRGYHATNLAIHLGAALALFGLIRRTARREPLRAALGGTPPDHFALGVALLWAVHPLCTESVTYIVQRAESLMGLFFLLTLYAVARATETERSGRWSVAAFIFCLLGMGTKEVMVAAPLLALLYDRTFAAGSFAGAWRTRKRLHLALASTWLLLAWLVVQTGNRGGSAGFGTLVTPWEYLLTQAKAIPLYLRLALWPAGLALDRGVPDIPTLAAVALPLAGLGALALTTFWAAWRRPLWGFVGLWFFAILAPSSSFVPVASQTIAEHRMYLPLIAPMALLVFALWRLPGRPARFVVPALAAAAIVLTAVRNHDYRSAQSIWEDTYTKVPSNPRAVSSYGWALAEAGRLDEGETYLRRAIEMLPLDASFRLLFGRLLERTDRLPDAAAQFAEAVQLEPEMYEARSLFAQALQELGRNEESLTQWHAAATLRPDSADVRYNLASCLLRAGRTAEALPHFEAALQLDPTALDARGKYVGTLLELGRLTDAQRECAVLAAKYPARSETHLLLGRTQLALGRAEPALDAFRAALRLDASLAEAHAGAGEVLIATNRVEEGIAALRAAVRLQPALLPARNQLGIMLLKTDRPAEAAEQFAALLAAAPGSAPVHNNHGIALAQLGRLEEAQAQFEAALRTDPHFADARDNLARLQPLLTPARP